MTTATTPKLDIVRATQDIRDAALELKEANRHLIKLAGEFAAAVESVDYIQNNRDQLSIDATIDIANRARGIVSDFEEGDTPADLEERAQELTEIAEFYVTRFVNRSQPGRRGVAAVSL